MLINQYFLKLQNQSRSFKISQGPKIERRSIVLKGRSNYLGVLLGLLDASEYCCINHSVHGSG